MSRLARMAHVAHLARRFIGSLSPRPPSSIETAWALALLLPSEQARWHRLAPADQRHSVLVARRFAERCDGAAPRAAIAGALLHDIGKLDANLGTAGRVVATLAGPCTERFRRYHSHEAIGARWLTEDGSDPSTVELVAGTGTSPHAAALAWADDI